MCQKRIQQEEKLPFGEPKNKEFLFYHFYFYFQEFTDPRGAVIVVLSRQRFGTSRGAEFSKLVRSTGRFGDCID